jgi:hypothetical protein
LKQPWESLITTKIPVTGRVIRHFQGEQYCKKEQASALLNKTFLIKCETCQNEWFSGRIVTMFLLLVVSKIYLGDVGEKPIIWKWVSRVKRLEPELYTN